MIASERLIPTQAAPTVATYTISSDGNRLGPELTVLSLVVDHQVNRIPTATLVIRDGEVSAQTFKVSESGDFDPGKEIVIELGYRASNTEIFRGEVTGQQLKIRNQRSLLVVTIKDPAYKMSIGRRSRYFSDQTDSDAWEAIIRSSGLSSAGEGTTAIVPELTQHLCTDWDFVMSRVEANGMVCVVKAGELQIKRPKLERSAVLKLEYGANLLSFDGALDARQQFSEAEATAWRPTDAEPVTETASPSVGDQGSAGYITSKLAEAHGLSPWQLHHGGDLSVDELTGWATATAERSELSRVRGAAAFQGTAAIEVGNTVELAGMGAVFNSNAYVAGLRHEMADGQWRTMAQLGLEEELFAERFPVSAPPAGGLLPAVSGLQVATVIQMHDDPTGEERILVKIPALNPEGEGNWARLATGMAGNEAGLTFRPAVGDEVLVGFLDDDPRYPVILGGLHASGTPAPLAPTEDNEQTGYVSRGGNKWVVNDTKKSIVLETATGDTLSMLGEDGVIEIKDQHGNSLKMASDGITIESAGKLTLKAATDLSAEGVSAKIKSSASGEFQAGANLTLKGSLVQIN